jgi:nicotinamide-nucleotide amidase
VKPETLKLHTEISQDAAREMASGAKEVLGVDLAVSITGIAGPGGGTPEKPVGFVCIGLAGPEGVESFEYKLFGDREQLKYRFSQLALMTLLEALEKIAGN